MLLARELVDLGAQFGDTPLRLFLVRLGLGGFLVRSSSRIRFVGAVDSLSVDSGVFDAIEKPSCSSSVIVFIAQRYLFFVAGRLAAAVIFSRSTRAFRSA
jgi:hypothetical protein